MRIKMALLSETPRIFWAGDSTVKQNDFTSYPQCGIGQGFSLFVKKEILIVNRAENGRSTKSFIDEGRLDYIRENIRKGDFLFVQFGHNDEKNDPLRYTDPQGSFKENLRTFIKVAHDIGAYPLLITPLYRRIFESEGKLVDNTHLTYPQRQGIWPAVSGSCTLNRVNFLIIRKERRTIHIFNMPEQSRLQNCLQQVWHSLTVLTEIYWLTLTK